MPLPDPLIDDRSYQQILSETLARIPVHNPEWTNYNDSDPGVTLLQLFAFMTESLLYRANLVPRRNRLKFLRLLGVPMQPAAAAEGLVTFSNPRGPLEVRLLPPDLELFAGPVPFRTLDGLDVLPIEAQVYYKGRPNFSAEEQAEAEGIYRQLYEDRLGPEDKMAFYEAKLLEPPVGGGALPALNLNDEAVVVDGSLWVALLARKGDDVAQARMEIADQVLTLAVLPAVRTDRRILPPGGWAADEVQTSLIYEVPHVTEADGSSGPRYRELQPRPSGNLLVEPGIVELPLPGAGALQTWREEDFEPSEAGFGDFPPSLEDAAVADRVITWIRIRLGETPEAVSRQLNARISYVGINAARVTQRARISAEFAGQGTGAPDQVVALVNTPVLPESVQLTVNGEVWTRTDDLAAAPSEVPRGYLASAPRAAETEEGPPAPSKVYTVERESGLVRFGSGLRGARPPSGAVIQASYDYGGGLQGMVGLGAITKGPMLPAGVKVSNPAPTWGGDEPETVEEAERQIPRFLRHRDRLVSKEDFADIARRTPGVDLGRVEVLPLVHPDLRDLAAEGVVTLLVIPRYDPVQPEAPVPDRLFLDAVCRHLDPRRLITTELHVLGPRYVPLYVSVGLDVVPGRNVAPVREAVKDRIRRFLSPLVGGFEERGWPLEHNVDALELLAVAARVDGVARVNGVLLARGTEPAGGVVPISGLELPRLVAVTADVGSPPSLERLRGESVPPGTAPQLVPVPVVPPDC